VMEERNAESELRSGSRLGRMEEPFRVQGSAAPGLNTQRFTGSRLRVAPAEMISLSAPAAHHCGVEYSEDHAGTQRANPEHNQGAKDIAVIRLVVAHSVNNFRGHRSQTERCLTRLRRSARVVNCQGQDSVSRRVAYKADVHRCGRGLAPRLAKRLYSLRCAIARIEYVSSDEPRSMRCDRRLERDFMICP
jgi:hypothetical protein